MALFLFSAHAEARWIGDYERDYSDRLEIDRVSRDAITQAREEREAQEESRLQRLQLRTSRTRSAPGRTLQSAQKYFAVSQGKEKRDTVIRMEERIRRRGVNRASLTKNQATSSVSARSSTRFDARRRGDLATILEYVIAVQEDVSVLTASQMEICKFIAASCIELLDLRAIITDRRLTSWPVDPEGSDNENGTGYFIQKSGNGFVLTASKGNGGDGITLEWHPIVE